MSLSEVRTARDYNRGLAAPLRWLRTGVALARAGPRGVAHWAMAKRGRAWVRVALLGLIGFVMLLPLDGTIARAARWVNGQTWGDTARVLQWLQEYGQGPSVVLVAILIWQLDPGRRRQLVHWLIGVVIAAVLLNVIKLGVGRPRPKFDEPLLFLGPFGEYPLGPGLGVHHAWEFWVPRSWELWSMPSSHAAYAAVMSYFLGSLYPRIRGLVVALAAVVCLCRVLYGAHYPSDVLIGAVIGTIAGRLAMQGSSGSGALADASRPATDSPGAPG